jgi:glycosyltransferase involved in cell wall biosynthesis
MTSVSLIIPCKEKSSDSISGLLQSIISWTVHPLEIIIVDSSEEQVKIPEIFISFCKTRNLVFNHLYFQKKNFYPGHARNIGLSHSNSEYIAFLDVKTTPSNIWLGESLKLINKTNSLIVWGNTFYDTNNKKEEIIRAATFGSLPIKTLPGSIIHRDVFNKCGNFIEKVRAGEDADWMKRCELHHINCVDTNESCNYSGLVGMSYVDVLKKWYRNYLSASFLPYISPHKDLYFYSISAILIVIAYNWNWFWLDWRLQDTFYLPNITKISILIISLFYIFFRGIFIPRKKGVEWGFLAPLNFIRITILSASIDIIKALAFLKSKITR